MQPAITRAIGRAVPSASAPAKEAAAAPSPNARAPNRAEAEPERVGSTLSPPAVVLDWIRLEPAMVRNSGARTPQSPPIPLIAAATSQRPHASEARAETPSTLSTG